jgi:ABC-type polysaccharide/polyol phosphate export permease
MRVLEGTSSDLSVKGGPPSEAPRSLETAAERPREPRPEIWFHRKVNFLAAVKELWRFRELTVTLAERDLRVRYKQAVLGVAWAVIGPLVMTIAFVVLLNRVTKVNTGGVPGSLFVSLSLLPWTFFSSSLSNGGLSLVTNNELLNKLYCPREVFPIAAIADAAVDAVIATFVMSLLFPITGFAPKAEAYYLPLLLLVMVMFTLGMTLAVSAIVVYARDLRLVLPLAIQVGLFATPVAYRVSTISDSKLLQVIYSAVDPIAPVIEGMRATVLEGRAPEWTLLGVGAASSLIVLMGGFMLFKRLETGMADIA